MSAAASAGAASSNGARQAFIDKSTYPLRALSAADGVRVVPGGSSIRDGCYIGRGVICMPPMFVNVGAYVGENTMIDSHALIGSCAQIGRGCHISAGSQIGGVLEPVGALPVIIEDEVLVGGNCGVYEGTVVKRRAVLGTGTILNRSIPVYDLVREAVYSATETEPLLIPEGAVVVPGSRAISRGTGKEWGLSVQAAVIVKYRDAKTEARVQLEDLLRYAIWPARNRNSSATAPVQKTPTPADHSTGPARTWPACALHGCDCSAPPQLTLARLRLWAIG
jgi:2,3,4,5-tetrahydropyridine-2,6-dicarboxylate N-succinyltransferase